jgi:hypothetical protein
MSTQGPVATLAGVPLLADEPVGWEFTQGVRPFIRAFVMDNASAQKVLDASKGFQPVQLVIKLPQADPLTVKKLYVVGTAAARAPYLTRVIVADGRVLWQRKHVTATYNRRRATGNKFLAADLKQLAVIPSINDYFYAKYSMKDPLSAAPLPWTAYQMIADVFSNVAVEGGYSMAGFDAASALPIESFELDDTGDQAVERALAYVPGQAVWIDSDGVAQLTTRSGAAEAKEFINDPIVGPDLVADVDLSDVRPSAVEVYFTVEQEVRFDYIENAIPATGSPNVDPRTLTNVLPLPDPYLIGYKGRADKVYQGTWVPIDQDLLNAWNDAQNSSLSVSVGSMGATMPNITFDLICKFFFWPGGYSAFDEIVFGANPVWQRRWAALQQHYRQTYRIPDRWWDRLKAVYPYRASFVDYVTGARAPSQAYQNYTVVPTIRRIAKKNSDPTRQLAIPQSAWNVTDYTYGKLPDVAPPSQPVPTATVDVVDNDQGIVRVNVHPDVWGDYSRIIPSNVKSIFGGTNLPTWDPANQADVTAGFLASNMQLDTQHAASVVLTCVPASPNNLAQFYKITVTPDQAKTMLPRSVQNRMTENRGPVWRIRVGPGTLTARFAWLDSHSTNIENAFFLSSLPGTGTGTPVAAVTWDDTMLTNYDQLKAMAYAAAASIYSGYADRFEGTHVTAFDAVRRPVGRIGRVVQELAPSGAAITQLNAPPDRQGIDVFAMLPESIRRQILGLVNPNRQGRQ